LDAAETAAASASESAAVAMASVERAEGAAVAAESAADAAVEKVSDLEKDIALLNTALMQGGITYKADTETEYNERITAGGLNVLDGSLARLEKVVGSTVAYNTDENGMNGKLASASFAGIESTGKNILNQALLSGGEFVTFNGKSCYKYVDKAGANFSFKTDFKKNQQYTITAKIYREESQAPNPLYLRVWFTDGTKQEVYFKANTLKSFTTTANKTVDYIDGLPNYSQNSYLDLTVTQIEAGTTATEFAPYVVNTFDFPKTETPLGVTIDFENKKITDYGVDLVLTGTEAIEICTSYSNEFGYGVNIINALSTGTSKAVGVCTDAVVGTLNTSQAVMQLGLSTGGNIFPNIYWAGILKTLGIYTGAEQPTGETLKTAIASFKAYLAQRYADGNPVKIRYLSSVLQSETDFTEGNEYRVWANGTERVLGNGNAAFGVKNTLLQNYIVVKE
jgi:hypothetical protein